MGEHKFILNQLKLSNALLGMSPLPLLECIFCRITAPKNHGDQNCYQTAAGWKSKPSQ